MEILPVDLDSLVIKSGKNFAEIGIKHYKMPDVSAQTYRIYFKDGTHQDVEADNASHAYQQSERQDIVRIANLRLDYTNILSKNVIAPSGKKVEPTIDIEAPKEKMKAQISERAPRSFEMLDFTSYAELSKSKSNVTE